MNMKKKLISAVIIGTLIAASFLKADTKKRVSKLEQEMVKLSKSERKAWDSIAEMDNKISELERKAAELFFNKQSQEEDELDPEDFDLYD